MMTSQGTERAELAAHASQGHAVWANAINAKYASNATVRRDDFERIMEALKEIQRLNLHAIADLQAAGLTVDTDIKDMVVTKENVSAMEAAKNSMNLVQLSNNNTQFGFTSTPQPITHHTHSIDYRQGFGYKVTTGNKESMRQVMELSENNVVNGDATMTVTISTVNQVLYGYTSHPNRTTVAIDDWASSTTNLMANVNSLISAMYNTNKIQALPGSLILYVPTNSWMVLRQQAFSNKGSLTFHDQILQDYPEIGKIVPLTKLATGNPVLVHMRPQYVQLGQAQAPVTVPHVKNFILQPQLFTTYAVWCLLIHVDVNDLTGIVQGT